VFYQNFKGELTPVFLKPFHKIEKKGMLRSLLYKAGVTLILKLDEDKKKTVDQCP
jgi:hypothetical protein